MKLITPYQKCHNKGAQHTVKHHLTSEISLSQSDSEQTQNICSLLAKHLQEIMATILPLQSLDDICQNFTKSFNHKLQNPPYKLR